jgi:hypothetical protein
MDLELGGRTAVVTGASKGIGLAITRALAGAGAHVVAGAQRSSAELDELADGGRVRFVPSTWPIRPGRGRSPRRPERGSTSWSTTSAAPGPGPAAS